MSDTQLRQYMDSEGKPIGLLRLVKMEPEWACNQIRHRDKLESERDALKQNRDEWRNLATMLIQLQSGEFPAGGEAMIDQERAAREMYERLSEVER